MSPKTSFRSGPVKVLLVGAGARGVGYARYALEFPERMQVVAVADPTPHRRREAARLHSLPESAIFNDWREAIQADLAVDAVFICTQDRDHLEPAVAFAGKGLHILLEKPMAPTEADCRTITEAAQASGAFFAVCHVLRYTAYTKQLKALLDDGLIGEIVSLQHIEGVGHWHQAHSFVRGNWGREADSSFMLLAKSCHDLDWIRYLMGQSCQRVSSFGSLYHFRKEQRPEGAADRCLDCAVEPTCPYSAPRIYLGRLAQGHSGWPTDVLIRQTEAEAGVEKTEPSPVTAGAVIEALRTGPYGRCVYACDNDVVDHQVVNMEFAGGQSASFTMTAFAGGGRKTRIFGTRGELDGDERTIRHRDFLTGKETVHEVNKADGSILGGHGGGDFGLISAFIEAVGTNNPSLILSDAAETLESHRMTFAAEQSRRSGEVVTLNPS